MVALQGHHGEHLTHSRCYTTSRDTAKLTRFVKEAGFPERANLEDIEYRSERGLEKQRIVSLATCEWIRKQLNVIILGSTGVGKTWLACAFGSQACRFGFTVSFFRASDLYEQISTAVLDGSLAKFRQSLQKPSLLVIDDFGLGQLTLQVAQVLLDVIDHRARKGSLLITSQFPTAQWHDLLPDKTLADAILDRIVLL